ncbi:hypothetical protein [Actinomadura geliboluensis]|uniref:Uncharacterized protein n=1 Tax=Actinomadura geliboluensis TaxID=882440 RepID=A0A5S4HAE1_9ACTN|nr:hypothetical protein [Actinomadura geliboluensis]TMR42228.1 hypothetical protein ETD96_01370 [Actinomadura geliboluensis]
MRIPRRVDASLEWLEKHIGALAATVAMIITAASTLWLPSFAGFIPGLAIGGLFVHLRLTKRLAKARRDVDDLLRDNGALRHRNTILTSGVIAQDTQMTHKFVPIGETVAEAQDTHGTLPLPQDGTGSTA